METRQERSLHSIARNFAKRRPVSDYFHSSISSKFKRVGITVVATVTRTGAVFGIFSLMVTNRLVYESPCVVAYCTVH